MLDTKKFLGGASRLDAYLEIYKTSETKSYFPGEWFVDPKKLNNSQLPPYQTFFSKLRNVNPLEKDYSESQSLKDEGFTCKEALSKLKLKQLPATAEENYQYLTSVWQQENMCTFKDFLHWYNNKNVIPSQEVMQKMVDLYNNKGIDTLKFGCTLANLAGTCLHKSTTAKLYPLTESDKDLSEKICEDMVGGPFIVLTREAAVDETLYQDSTNLCKSKVGIDASQLYPFSMCRAMPTGMYTRWELDPESGKIKPRPNKRRSFENMVMS